MKSTAAADFLEREAYARELGYTVKDSENGLHQVYRQGESTPLALCVLHWDAVRIACDLAEAFPIAEGYRQMCGPPEQNALRAA